MRSAQVDYDFVQRPLESIWSLAPNTVHVLGIYSKKDCHKKSVINAYPKFRLSCKIIISFIIVK